jgi:hypothetical protein
MLKQAVSTETSKPKSRNEADTILNGALIGDGTEHERQVLVTTDYSIFHFLTKNRVDLRVPALLKRVRALNLLPYNEIKVTADFGVLDGQRRLEAAKAHYDETGELWPIHYIVYEDLRDSDITGLFLSETNSGQVKWTLNDFLHLHLQDGLPDYIRLKKFMDKTNEAQSPMLITLKRAIGLLMYGENNHADTRIAGETAFRNGSFNCLHTAFAQRMVEVFGGYADCRETAHVAKKRNFQSAVLWTITSKQMTMAEHLNNIKRLSGGNTQYQHFGNTIELFIQAVEQVHNYHRSSGIKRLHAAYTTRKVKRLTY